MLLTGEDIMNVLNDLKAPGSLTGIVKHLSTKNKVSETDIREDVKVLIAAGVRFGCIVEEENKYHCKEQINEKEANNDKNKEALKTVISNNEIGSSRGSSRKLNSEKKKKSNEIENQHNSSEDNEEYESDFNDAADCYGPSSRRRRSRSRNQIRRRSGKRIRSRRRNYR